MTEDSAARRRPARPVADAPVDSLVAGARGLAKGWLLALLEDAPFEGLAALPTAELARDAPRLCAAIAHALRADHELERLRAGDLAGLAARAGALAGVREPAAVVAALDSLRAVVWGATLDALVDPSAAQVAELAERLARVCSLVAGASLRAAGQAPARAPEAQPGWEAPADAEWLSALVGQLGDAGPQGRRVALLLFEIDDADRVLAAEGAVAAGDAFARVAQAVRTAIRWPDVVAYEQGGRTWVIAADTGRAGARALAARVEALVDRTAPVRGVPLRVSIGLAVFPEDGHEARALAMRAEEALFFARAGGERVGQDLGPELRPVD